MTLMKPNLICSEGPCTGWRDTVYVNGKEWLKCSLCGHMVKLPKRKVTPL